MSEPKAHEPQDDPEYQEFINEMMKFCRCEVDAPCDSVLAAGPCEQNTDLGLDDYDGEYDGEDWWTIEKLIEHLQVGDAPQHKVIIAGHDSENTEILFEPYSLRWERGAVVIEADLSKWTTS